MCFVLIAWFWSFCVFGPCFTNNARRVTSDGWSYRTHVVDLCSESGVTALQPNQQVYGMGISDWNVSMVDIHLRKLLCVYCPGHAGVKRNDRADRLLCKATLTNGFLLGRSEVVRSLRDYLRAQSQGHHTIDRLEDRGVERGSARRSSSKGRERDHHHSDEHRNCFKGDVVETSETMGGAIMGFSGRINTILNWTERVYFLISLTPTPAIFDVVIWRCSAWY